jgi:hypothetical protein
MQQNQGSGSEPERAEPSPPIPEDLGVVSCD